MSGAAVTFWVDILRCRDNRFYTGDTDDLERRVAQHRHGGYCDFTARRRPVALVWSETFQTRIEALVCERQMKGWTRAKKEALIRGDWQALSWLAKPPGARPSTSLGTNGEEGMVSSQPVRPEPVEGRARSGALAVGDPAPEAGGEVA